MSSSARTLLTDDRDLESDGELHTDAKGDVDLSGGEPLDASGVDRLLQVGPISLVTIIGERDSGKTTLICSIYERFLKGSFANLLFAGSRTLIGLDRRHHYSRVESGLVEPDTPRTSILEGLLFYHFSVAAADSPMQQRQLVLSDRAGETYRQARGDSSLVSDLFEVGKADVVVLLLDGGRLVNSIERSGAIQTVRQTLRALLDGGALHEHSAVQVVTTKWDLVQNAPDAAARSSELEAVQDRILRDFGSRLNGLTFWRVAARATAGTFEPAWGVADLLRTWIQLSTREPALQLMPERAIETEFDRLLERTPMSEES